jgi:hypothetical protein
VCMIRRCGFRDGRGAPNTEEVESTHLQIITKPKTDQFRSRVLYIETVGRDTWPYRVGFVPRVCVCGGAVRAYKLRNVWLEFGTDVD